MSYSQPITVMHSSGKTAGWVLYLHGHANICPPLKVVPFDKLEVIQPKSVGQCTTYEEELVPNFQQIISKFPVTMLPGILVGHSGAYRAMASLMDKYPWHACILLDAMYTTRHEIVDHWVNARIRHPHMKIFCVYRKNSSTTLPSLSFETYVSGTILISTTIGHCDVPQRYFSEVVKLASADL